MSVADDFGEMFSPSFYWIQAPTQFEGKVYKDRYSAPDEAEGSPAPEGFSNCAEQSRKLSWQDLAEIAKTTGISVDSLLSQLPEKEQERLEEARAIREERKVKALAELKLIRANYDKR